MMSLDPLRRSILPSLILAAILALPRPLLANTLTVTNLGDSGMNGQLRTLITLATPGDTIVIPAGTITLAGPAGENLNGGGDLDISKNLTIQGAGPGVTIIDGGGIDRVFDIDPSGGGGIEVTISGVTITGGAVSCSGACQARGGGLFNQSTLTLTNSTLSGNTASCTNSGSGECNAHAGLSGSSTGTVTLTNITLSGNTASCTNSGSGSCSANGGLRAHGTVTLTNSTLSGNTASCTNSGSGSCAAAGGGIANTGLGGTLTVTNSTLSGNTASCTNSGSGSCTTGGGGILNTTTLAVLNATVTANSVTCSGVGCATLGGGLLNFDGTTTLQNTIVAKQLAGADCGNSFGTITSLGHNLDSDSTCGFNQPGDLSNTAPLLGPLQSNGGPTQTHSLLPGSPAIDAGDDLNCPATDQRGFPSPKDGNGDSTATCDIGAVELGAVALVGNFGDTGAQGQLRDLINSAPPGDTVVIPAGTITLTAQAGGSLEIFQSLTLEGAGPGLTIIDGGGIGSVLQVTGGSVVISGVTIRNGNAGIQSTSREGITSNGSSAGRGGAFCIGCLAPVTDFSLSNTVLERNMASEGGGAIAIVIGTGPVTLNGVTLSGNTAGTFGGGIFNGGAPLTLINSTVSRNSAGASGGGIASAAGPTTLTNVTLSDNSANTSGGGIFNQGGAVQLKNTIVANSRSGGNCAGLSPITSLGHNLDSGTTCGFTGLGDLSNTDPKLDPLANNGGDTQTHALRPDSQAIDAGDPAGCTDNLGAPLATDQRGVARPQGAACDIGAYEFVPVPATLPQILNVGTLQGMGGSAQQTFLTSDFITVEATYVDPNPGCAGVAPVLLQALFFNLEGQLILTRQDASSETLSAGSKSRLLFLDLLPGALPAGTYQHLFLLRDCTSTNIFVSGFTTIRVLTP